MGAGSYGWTTAERSGRGRRPDDDPGWANGLLLNLDEGEGEDAYGDDKVVQCTA